MYLLQKRLFDILFSLFGLVILGWLFAIIALGIKLDSPGPVFYKGVRVGKGERPFRMWKFRTMVFNAAEIGPSSTAADDLRITRAGRILRGLHLDEAPQFVNVLLGDMSIVGPRPQVPWAVEGYTEQEKMLLMMRPGITDLASIKFSDEGELLRGSSDPDRDYFELIHPEKMRLNMQYVRTCSMLTDVRIVIQTLWTIVSSQARRAKR